MTGLLSKETLASFEKWVKGKFGGSTPSYTEIKGRTNDPKLDLKLRFSSRADAEDFLLVLKVTEKNTVPY